MKRILFVLVALLGMAQGMLAATAGSDPYCPDGLSIDNDYTPGQAGYYYANLVKGQNVTVTLSETNLRFMVYDHGGKSGDYSSDGNSQSMTINAPEGCVFVVSGTILGIEGFAGDTFELFDGQNRFYSYNEDDYVVIPSYVTTSNSLKVSFNTPQATSNPGFELTVRVWDRYTEVGTASELTAAVADGALIRLTKDITLPAYLSIGYDTNQNVSIDQTVTLDLNGHTLRRNLNAADANGHVIEVHSKGNLTITDSSGDNSGTITGGWANNGGGICNYGTVNFEGGTITGCKAAGQGGGIKNNANATLTITGGVITGNSAPNGGGIYNIENGTLNISGVTISSNTASVDGGGIVNRGTASINNASIQNNTATANGGGVWNCGTMTLGDAVTIRGNSALNGGGIFLTGGSNATLSGTTIRDNTSTVAGGILMDQGTATSLTDCTITGNNATVYGGGGIVNYGNFTLNGSTITGNTCAGQGGGLWTNGTVNMQGTVTIRDNATSGGLTNNVFLKTGCVITVTGNLGSSLIGVALEDNEGRVTSGLGSYGSISNFLSDRSTITTLGMAAGEVCLSRNSGIYYVERGWDNTNRKVTETLQLRTSDNTQLTNTSGVGSITLENGKWYYVQGGNISYSYITVGENATAHLILCDGGRLTSTIRLRKGSSLSIYGQVDGTGAIVANASESEYAGIGTITYYDATLNIYGGTIAANGGSKGAGIGASYGQGMPTINILGGKVTATGGAYAAGIGSSPIGSIAAEYLSQGTITIYGGNVEAHGGDLGAGIGGGDDRNGSTTGILGGTVYAYGGNDAAGIGSGQDSYGGTHGGTITISGGHVYAYGNDVAAGIGAGEDADMGNITITGGIVEAHGGGGESWANGIATDDDNEGVNSITLGDNMMVTSERDFTYPERYDAVKGRKDVIIKPCTHSGATYTVGGTTTSGTHTMHCSYCKYSPTETHTFEGGICTVCHVSGSISTVSIYLPERVGDGYTDGHYAATPRSTQTFVTGSTFDLPAPPVTYLPSGVIFAGWRVGTPTALGITSYWIGESDVDVLEPGTTYTVSGDVSLTARYKGIDISLADNADNSAILYDYNGKLAQTVTLTGRTLYKDGAWNTLCLPFSVGSLDGTPLEGARVKTLVSATFADGTLTLNFTADLTAIEAGKPYIVKWATTGDDIVSPVFTGGLEITNSGSIAVTGDAADFVGNYSPYSTGGEDNTLLYVGADDKLYWPNADMTIGAFRAYFRLNGGLTASGGSSSATVRRTVLNFGDGTTSIDSASPKSSPEGKDFGSPLLQEGTGEALYDLSGRKVNSPLAPGIYIRNGKKIIVK